MSRQSPDRDKHPKSYRNSRVPRPDGLHDSRQHVRFWRDDSGSALVEMSFVLMLTMMLLVGTITAAIAFGRDNSVQNAAREATRFGATLPGPVDTLWLQTVRDVARAAASGDLDSGVSGQYICVALVGGGSDLSLMDTGGAETTADSECFSDGRLPDELRVQVITERDTTIQAVVFDVDVTLSSNAAARYERSP